MTRTHFVVTIRDDQHATCAVNTASQKLQKIECRLIGPVHIFEDHERGGTPLQIVEGCVENRPPIARGIDGIQQDALGLARDVVQRCEWTRRKERIARPPQNPPPMLPVGKLLYEAGFPNTRLAAHETDATAALCGGQPLSQIGKTLLALEQCQRRVPGDTW
jgi:hypothetical protein